VWAVAIRESSALAGNLEAQNPGGEGGVDAIELAAQG
jgi:hypothetical protein